MTWAVLLLLTCLADPAAAADYYVPTDYLTLQGAVDSVSAGDTIYALPGTYDGFRFNGRSVSVESEEGPYITIISGRVLFWDDELSDSRLVGFTITGGDGALVSFSSDASGTASGYVENCILEESTHPGVSIRGSGDPTLVNLDISECSLGIEVRDSSSATILNTNIHDNDSQGMEILDTASLTVRRCQIADNYSEGVTDWSPGTVSFDNCIFSGNGDYYNQQSGLFLGPTADAVATNCVFDNNWGGCDLRQGSTSTITNCIVTNNANYGIWGAAGITTTITYTCFRNNTPADLGGTASAGTGCIYTNPQYVPGGSYKLSDPDSPCIDAGDPLVDDFLRPPGLGALRSDMGAFGGAHNDWPTTLPPPDLAGPDSGSVCQPLDVLLDWSDVGDATGYMVEVGESCGLGIETEVVGSDYLFSGDTSTVYYWRVKTKDVSGGFGNYSACYSFETAPETLAFPLLEQPPNGSIDEPTDGQLDWADVSGATGYRAQIGTTCGSGDEHDVATSAYSYSGLDPETTYHWRVMTKDVCDNYGDYSSCFSFTTLAGGGDNFLRADIDGSGEVNISDPIYSLAYQFAGGPAPICMDAGDTDDSGEVNISDPIYNLAFQFAGGPSPPLPYPACGVDPSPDVIGCGSFPFCGTVPKTPPAPDAVVLSDKDGIPIFLEPVAAIHADRLEIAFGIESDWEVIGLEFTLSYDPVLVELLSVEQTFIGLDFLSARADESKKRIRIGCIPDMTLSSPLEPGRHRLGTFVLRTLRSDRLTDGIVKVTSGRIVLNGLSAVVFGAEAATSDAPSQPGISESHSYAGPVLDIPNPYRVNNRILLSVSNAHSADVALYGTDGRRIRTLFRGALVSGTTEFYWNGRTEDGEELGSGIYYLRVEVDDQKLSRKILLIK